ncbi:Gem-associated protein 2 [Entamoeba marina]
MHLPQAILKLPKESSIPGHPLNEMHDIFERNKQLREFCRNEKKVSFSKPNFPKDTSYFNKFNKRIPNPGESFRVPQNFYDDYKSIFEQKRREFNSYKNTELKHIPILTKNSFIPFLEKEPNAKELLACDFLQTIQLISFIRNICSSRTKYTKTFVQWVYGLLLILEKPYNQDTSNDLRKIMKYFCRARHAIFDVNDEMLPYYQVIITILSTFYQQNNNDDCI